MKTIDFNIGLAVTGDENLLTVDQIHERLEKLGFIPRAGRIAQSETEQTYAVRCSFSVHAAPLATRVYLLAAALRQDAIAAVPHDGWPPLCVGPLAHRWGGAFLPQYWISIA